MVVFLEQLPSSGLIMQANQVAAFECLSRRATSGISPGVGGLLGELCGQKGEVLPHGHPKAGFGNAAVVGVDGMDTSHFPSY